MNKPDLAAVPAHAIMEQAAQWFAVLSSGAVTPQERAAWSAWFEQAPEHQQAWRFVEKVSQRFAPVQSSAEPRMADQVLRRARQAGRRRVMLALAGMGVLGAAGWRVPGVRNTLAAWASDYRSPTGSSQQLRLADGTQVWINSGSAMDVEFNASLRRLVLTVGEIFIETAADPRPLVVDTPQGRMRALGTRYAVRREAGLTLLAVYGGAVELRLADGGSQVIDAGQQVSFNTQRILEQKAADPAREAWTRGILLARDIPLESVIAELARYRRGHLSLDPSVAGLRVYGGFPLADTDHALALLAEALPIRVRQTLPWWTSIEARD